MLKSVPNSVEGVFNDFNGRRIGLINALTTDAEKFYQRCDPKKENLCLYGLPDETWEVNPPGEVMPPRLPEPAAGINFARDGEQRNDWLQCVGLFSDTWLLSVAFYLGAQFGFGKSERERLFKMINDLETVLEVFEVKVGYAWQARSASIYMQHSVSTTIQYVFDDFKGRRAGLIKALTTDVEQFYQQCDPKRMNLCLYGLYDGTWEVNLPSEELPPQFPEPPLGLNYVRDRMLEENWLSLVAVHGDTWLLSLAFYFGAQHAFGKSDREKLFEMINGLPTVLEVYTEAAAQAVAADEEEGTIELKKEKKKKKKKEEEADVESAKKKKREKDKAKDEAVLSNVEKYEKKKKKKEVEEAGVESAKKEKRKKDKAKDEAEENPEKEKKKAARSPDVESAEEEKKRRKSDDVSLAPDAMMNAKLAVDEEEKEKKKKKKKEVDEAAASPDVESAKKEKKRKLDDVDVSPAPNGLKKPKSADDEEEKKEKKKKKVKEVDEAAPSLDGDSAKKDKAKDENASSNEEKSEKKKKKKKEKDAEAVGSGDGGSKSKKKKKKNKYAGEEE